MPESEEAMSLKTNLEKRFGYMMKPRTAANYNGLFLAASALHPQTLLCLDDEEVGSAIKWIEENVPNTAPSEAHNVFQPTPPANSAPMGKIWQKLREKQGYELNGSETAVQRCISRLKAVSLAKADMEPLTFWVDLLKTVSNVILWLSVRKSI